MYIKKQWQLIHMSYWKYLIHIGIFLFLIIFYTKISPLIPYDSDDWIYLSNTRVPFPLWDAWNPTRVFAEAIMMLGGYIAGSVIYPMIHD